ncbi:hypothetical protein ARMSODRAFT_1005992 [Armillaria solidipes]|uniref:MULE transposase domain-containing protein n=1 Tax=Armillaria solidipes TaxID=1076256 RepID=A0A2H3B6T7_9AGAR|nr:hypothetical protein ARMSODRAFT_1005992 [Armillaria solidipes]
MACLHYQPHELLANGHESRFELIISTPQQQEAAWCYGHQKQVLMDLTFRFSSSCVLLGILLAMDKNKHGIPLGFILFSARKDAKAVHADYNAELLDHLLERFKFGLGTNAKGEVFEIQVGNTDNNTRKRKALTVNWPGVSLLLCIFHVWQLLREVDEYDKAKKLYADQRRHFSQLSKNRNNISKLQGTTAIAFLDYFNSYISLESYWRSWSSAGAKQAALLLDVPLDRIAHTTNPLESFNGCIKGKYFAPYMHGGRLPRIDMWILLIITHVMPDFFMEIADKQANCNYITSLRTLTTDLSPLAQSAGIDYETNLMVDWLAQEQRLDDSEDTDVDVVLDVDAMEDINNPLAQLPAADALLHLRCSQSFEVIPKTPPSSFIFSSAPSSPIHATVYKFSAVASGTAVQSDTWLGNNSISINVTAGSDTHHLTNDSSITSEPPSMDSTQLARDAKLTTVLMELQRADDILFQALWNVLDIDTSLLDSGQLDEYISVTMRNRLTSYKESGSISGLSTLSDRQQSINTSSEGDNKADIELGPAHNTRNKKLIKFSPMIKEKRKEAQATLLKLASDCHAFPSQTSQGATMSHKFEEDSQWQSLPFDEGPALNSSDIIQHLDGYEHHYPTPTCAQPPPVSPFQLSPFKRRLEIEDVHNTMIHCLTHLEELHVTRYPLPEKLSIAL